MSKLTPEIEADIALNWGTMKKNFAKIGSIFKHGTESPYELPEHLANFVEGYGKLQDLVSRLAKGHNDAAKTIRTVLEDLKKAQDEASNATLLSNDLKKQVQELQKQVEALSKGGSKSTKNSKTTKSTKAESEETKEADQPADAVVETTEPTTEQANTELELTAQAIDAGEVSDEALAQLDSLTANLTADVAALEEI